MAIVKTEFGSQCLADMAWLRIAVLLVASLLLSWWTVQHTDRQMREELLQQARLVEQSLDIKRVRALSGTASDKDNPDHLSLKTQVAAIRLANPLCGFVYLMGRRVDGTIVFLLDAGPDDPAQPGEVYDDASPELRFLFDTGTPFVEGPLPDEWGVWVSAIVPLIDSQTGEPIAAVGMDIDAQNWSMDVMSRAAWPVGLILALLIAVAAALAAKRAVNATRESEERHRVLFDQSQDAMITMAAPSWRFTAGNPAALAMLGVKTTDEFLTLGPWDVSPERQPDGRPSVEKAQEMIETALRDGSHFFEWTCQRLDGETISCTALLTRMSVAGQEFIQVTVRDISAIKEAEAALRESEMKHRLILDHSVDLIWSLNVEGVFTYLSPSWKRVTGYEPSSIHGMSFQPLVHPEDVPACMVALSRAIKTGEAFQNLEFQVHHADGSWHWHCATAAPVRGPDGEVVSMVGVSRDITEQKRVAVELHWKTALLEAQLNSSLDGILVDDAQQKRLVRTEGKQTTTGFGDGRCRNGRLALGRCRR
ncbi:MAG: PAS domain-containing protein [Pirellulaceae bacterium]